MVMVVLLTVPTIPFGVLTAVPKNSLMRFGSIGRFRKQSFSRPIATRFSPIENLSLQRNAKLTHNPIVTVLDAHGIEDVGAWSDEGEVSLLSFKVWVVSLMG